MDKLSPKEKKKSRRLLTKKNLEVPFGSNCNETEDVCV